LLLVNFLFVPLDSGSFDWPRFSLSDENERPGDADDSDVTRREVFVGLESRSLSVLEEVVRMLSRAIFTAIHACQAAVVEMFGGNVIDTEQA
jgi:hypothetical protein